MKIYKIAAEVSEFEDEGRDPLENTEELAQFEAQKEVDEIQTKGGTSHTSEVISSITHSFEERLGSYFIASGAVGWFKYKDGNVYEVQVKPVGMGDYKDLYLKSRQNQPNKPM